MTLSFFYGLLFLATWRILRLGPTPPTSRPLWPAGLIALVVTGTAAQLLHPGLERSWERSASAIDGGELWRLGTSFLIQGGGAWGMGFNLLTLVITALLTSRVFHVRGRRANGGSDTGGLPAALGPVVWVAGGVLGNLLALAFGFPDGAGSSLSTMTLAVTAAVASPQLWTRSGRITVGILAAVSVALLALHDEHAIAAALGAVLGLGLRRGAPDRIVAGAACWVGTAVFFIGQGVAMAGVTNGYNPVRHMVSDLGMIGCTPADVGEYHTDVCSPWHLAMNLGFVGTGAALLAGTVLLRPLLPPGRLAASGAILLGVGGLGKIGAGLTPGDLYPGAHMAVAIFSGPAPTIGVLLLGLSLRATRPVAARTAILCGAIGVGGFAATSVAMSAGWAGLAERVAMYPVILWVIGAGAALLVSRRERRPVPRPAR
ncbi:hypothetical protein AXK57_02110 [Tsukamurella pulmonis]|uniref:DUF998 domain-containing protein n=1 Tax=Tsukamurella pulmonis TaxID=47312 RepID=UPI00079A5EF0|nr:DUF998 domain-containing protein [Tsukamurella pulmonis]KXP13053.1 hypothetical protein AXK57_02110 [Tsukamurella pulmonis]RDH09963.1 DUF998 domain-containing protein [Tsukamurella pulmonis]